MIDLTHTPQRCACCGYNENMLQSVREQIVTGELPIPVCPLCEDQCDALSFVDGLDVLRQRVCPRRQAA